MDDNTISDGIEDVLAIFTMSRVTAQAARLISLSSLIALVMIAAVICAEPPRVTAENVKTSATERAIRLARAGQTKEAVQMLLATLAARPNDLNARLALADIYARNNQSDQAEQEFREVLRLHPESPSAELGLGALYLNSGSLPAAEEAFRNAVRRHPELSEAHAQLALVLAREHKYKEALAHIRSSHPPASPSARVRYLRLVASIHAGLGDSHAAAHAMEKALQVMPADEEMQFATAAAEAEAGEWKACLRNIAPLFRRHPAPDSGLILLRAQLASHGDFTPTLQSLRALDLPADRKLALRIRTAEALASADQHREAAEELQEAVKMSDTPEETLLYNLAVEQYAAGQFDQASATADSLRARRDSAELEDLIGDIEEQKGDLSAAVHSHENAIAMAPHEERYRLSLGAELLKFGAYEPAVSVFQKAADLFPNSARLYVGMGMAYYLTEKYDDSVSAFLHAEELDGRSGRAISYLATTQLENAAAPSAAAIDQICGRAKSHPTDSALVTSCSALLFRKAYLADDRSAAPDLIHRLRFAARFAPRDPVANCSLGHALEWTQQLAEARHWLEICVRLRPDSAEDHYRLSRVYQELGLKQAAAEQADLTDKANAQRDQHQAMADKFAHEVLGQSRGATDTR
ncbi:MAG: tetratricopeptide repeat protein [Terriglobales bacterium]